VTTRSRRQWRAEMRPPLQRSNVPREVLETAVPMLPLLSVLAALGLSKRGVMPIDGATEAVLVLSTAVCTLMAIVIVRMLLGWGGPRISWLTMVCLVAGTVLAPVVLWFRNDGSFSPLMELAVSANVLCLLLGIIIAVLSRTLGRTAHAQASAAGRAASQSPDPSIPSTPRVRVRRRRGITGAVAQLGRMIVIAFFVAAAGVFVLLWVHWIGLSFAPVHNGVFVEESCAPTYRGCQSIGTWTSDDGSLRLDDVELDGAVGPDGSVHAQYRPGERDPGDGIVHTESSLALAPVLLPVVVVGSLGYAYHYGDSSFGWARWARRRYASRTLEGTPADVRGATRR
jgi:hypothetical protein